LVNECVLNLYKPFKNDVIVFFGLVLIVFML